MLSHPIPSRFALLCLALPFMVSPCLAQVDPGLAGEPVPRASFGLSRVETMQVVLERQRAMASTATTRLSRGRNGAQGVWMIPSRRAHPRAHSAPHAIINKWGDTRMGIGFGRRVDFEGAWFGGQGGRGAWTTGIRILGYRGGELVRRSEWQAMPGGKPTWIAAALPGVDRIEIHSRAVLDGAGWYSMDDLTYRLPAVEGAAVGEQVVVDFDDLGYRKTLTGSGYAGLVWETGSGSFAIDKLGGKGSVREVPAPRSPTRELPALPDAGGGPQPSLARNQGRAPNLVKQFVGAKLGDPGGGSIPPDSCGACGLDHFVSFVNLNVSVFRKSDGRRLLSVGSAAFWGKTVGDPRVVFDPHSKRFFAGGMDGPTGNLYFAVSLTSDPMGSWFKTSWVAGVGSDIGTWPDFPTLGVDKRGVYLAALMVGRSTITIWAVHKAPLLQATPVMGLTTAWRGLPWEGAVQPCVTYGDDGGVYLVSRRDPGRLRVRRIEGPLKTGPKLLDRGFVTVPLNLRGPNAPSLGGAVALSTGDFRPSMAVWRNDSLWTAQTVAFQGRAAVRWYEINTKNMRAKQVGTVADPVRHYFYPSICVNARGDVAMGFSGSHAGEYAGCYFTGRLAADPAGEMGKPVLLKAGLGVYNIVTGSGVVRWGDYSATSLDPADDRSFWTIQEYARKSTFSSGIWGTRIGRLDFDRFPYGSGWPGTSGVPELSLDGPAYLANTPNLVIANSQGTATVAWLAIGLAPASIPLLDGTLLVQPAVVVNLPLPATGLRLPISIPNNPALLQQSFYLQVVQADSGASRGLAFSRGLETRIGR